MVNELIRCRFLVPLALLAGLLAGCGSSDVTAVKPLSGPTVAELSELPGVHFVDVRLVDQPTSRIIHVLNWHFIDKTAFAADIRSVAGKPITDDEIDRRYDEFLDEVEAVQIEQVELLRAIIARHKIKQVFCEGLTADNLPGFNRMVATLRKYKKPKGETPIAQLMLWQYRKDMLEIGAAGRLLMTGELSEVFAVEDPELLKAANPLGKDGSVRIDAAANERRETAIVKTILNGRSVAVIILGGSHDLSDNVPAGCEYIRLQTKRHRQFAE